MAPLGIRQVTCTRIAFGLGVNINPTFIRGRQRLTRRGTVDCVRQLVDTGLMFLID